MEGRIKEGKQHLQIGAIKERLIRRKGNPHQDHQTTVHKEAVREGSDRLRNATHRPHLAATGPIAADHPCNRHLDLVVDRAWVGFAFR